LVLINDSDIDTDALLNVRPQDEFLEVLSTGFSGLDNGVASTQNGIVTFTPDEDWHGVEEFAYTAIFVLYFLCNCANAGRSFFDII
jgi:hypothetical protein